MISMKKTLLIAAASIGLIGIVQAFPHGAGHGGLHGRQGEMLMELISVKLDLTDQQEDKFFAIRTKIKTLFANAREQRISNQQQIMDLIASPALDQQAVVSLIDDQMAYHRAHIPDVVALIAEFTDSLDVEQKQELADLLHKRFNHRSKDQ